MKTVYGALLSEDLYDIPNKESEIPDIATTYLKLDASNDPMTGDLDLGSNNLTNTNSLQFDTTPTAVTPAEGLLQWNATDGTLNMGMSGGDITLQVGQEQFIKVKNNTGSTLLNGKCIYIDNADTGRPTAELANNKGELMAKKTIAILTQDIADGDEGYGTTFGKVRGVDTSSYTLGEILYVAETDGDLTNTRPIDGRWITNVGVVTVVSATVGEIFVRSIQYERPDELNLIGGFPNQNSPETTITCDVDAGVGTFTIAPTGSEFRFYQLGIQYRKTTSESIEITDVEGVHWIYYNLGVLSQIVNPNPGQGDDLIRNKCLVAQLYWDATNNQCILLGDERHGFVMASDTHAYLHYTQGAKWISGMGLNTINATGDGSLDAHAQFGVDAGVGTDEDKVSFPTAVTATTGLPIFYLLGSTATLRRVTQAGFSVYQNPDGATNRLMYNQFTGGAWQLTEVTEANYVLCHVFETNDSTQPYVAFIGQNEYTRISDARTGAESEIGIIVVTFPKQEMIPVATVIFQTDKDYGNSINARVVEVSSGVSYVDWRSTNIVASSTSTPTDHNSLTGIQGGAIGDYYHLTNAEVTELQAVDTTYVKLDGSNTPTTGTIKLKPTTGKALEVYSGTNPNPVAYIDEDGNGRFLNLSGTNTGDVTIDSFDSTISSISTAQMFDLTVNEENLVHNDIGSKQGGTAGEYYHLTSAEVTELQAVDTTYLKLTGGAIVPTANSTTTFQIFKQDGTTNIFNVDTTNGRVGIGTVTPSFSLSLNGDATQTIAMERHSTANTAGQSLIIQAGGAATGATDKSGGNLGLYAGTRTGNGTRNVVLIGAPVGATASTTVNPPVNILSVFGASATALYCNLGSDIGNALTGAPVAGNCFNVSGLVAGAFAMYRNTTADTAGNELTIQAGGSTSGSTNKSGGTLNLSSGISTGSGSSIMKFNTSTIGSTGTTDTTPSLKAWIGANSPPRFFIGDSLAPVGSASGLNFTGNTGAWNVLVTRHTTANTAGNNLTIQAGGATSGATDKAGGTLILSGGISTGTARGSINFNCSPAGSTGSADNTPTLVAYLTNISGLSWFALTDTATTTGSPFSSSNQFLFKGNNPSGVGMYRHTTANTAGNILTVQAGGATSAATDKNGGTLLQKSGISTGTGTSKIEFQTPTPAAGTGTADNAFATRATIDHTGMVVVGNVTANNLREKLTAARTYYVRTDGNDSNTGLANTSGGAFLTIQKAIDVVSGLDINGQVITIQIADGTYTGLVSLKNITGFSSAGNLVIQGNSTTPANVVINTAGTAFSKVGAGSIWDVKNLKITTSSSGHGLLASYGASIRYSNIDFGTLTGNTAHLKADNGGQIVCIGNYAVSGNAYIHMWSDYSGIVNTAAITVVFSNNPVFSYFAVFDGCGVIAAYSMTFTNKATVTAPTLHL